MFCAQHARPTPHLLVLFLAGAGCAGFDAEQRPGDPAHSILAPAEQSVTTQHVRVRSLVDGTEIAGSNAILTRRSGGVSAMVRTKELSPGEAVDVFWAIFNQPAACEHPNPLTGALCSPPDLFIPATEASLHYVATFTASADGSLAYKAALGTGSAAGCPGHPFPCGTLTNPAGAEVHSPMFVPNGGPGRQAAQFLPVANTGRRP